MDGEIRPEDISLPSEPPPSSSAGAAELSPAPPPAPPPAPKASPVQIGGSSLGGGKLQIKFRGGARRSPQSGSPAKTGVFGGAASARKTRPAATFAQPDDDEEDELDPKTREAIGKVVIEVSCMGGPAEDRMRTTHRTNPAYWFLSDRKSSAYQLYRKRLKESLPPGQAMPPEPSDPAVVPVKEEPMPASPEPQPQPAKKRNAGWESRRFQETPWAPAPLDSASARRNSPKPSAFQPKKEEAERSVKREVSEETEDYDPSAPTGDYDPSAPSKSPSPPPKRKRRSRWGERPGDEAGPSTGSPSLTEAQARARKIALAALETEDPESRLQEEVAEGSWEHQRRAQEMEKTARAAKEATERRHTGGHHISHFLPKDELERLEAAKAGTPLPAPTAYEENKLSEENKGFQLLAKMGWAAGRGLGQTAQGITAPIAPGAPASSEHRGLGSASDALPGPDDDPFDHYRKRMMLAYRHRPNPLNNPRRQYY